MVAHLQLMAKGSDFSLMHCSRALDVNINELFNSV